MIHIEAEDLTKPKLAFARWLLTQKGRGDAIGDLARAAVADRAFPKDGDVEAVSKRLNVLQADPDMHVALEDAELDWAAL